MTSCRPALLLVLIPLLLAGQPVIRVKISAPRQSPELQVHFNRTGFGIGGECLLTVFLTADPLSRVTNFSVIEDYEYGLRLRSLKDIQPLPEGVPGLTVYRIRTEPMNPGVTEYRISVSGYDGEGLPFFRTTGRQIVVDDKLDASLVQTAEIGPFAYMSTALDEAQDWDAAIRRLRLAPAVRALKRSSMDYRVIIEGFADASDRVDLNQTLSLARARRTAETLSRHFGIPPERMTVTGRGAEEEPYPDTAGTRGVNRNRRVTLRFE